MKLFSCFLGTDDEKAVLDRRLFLTGAMVTAAGLIVPRPIISIPKPLGHVVPFSGRPVPASWEWEGLPPTHFYYFFDKEEGNDPLKGLQVGNTIIRLNEDLPALHPASRSQVIWVKPQVTLTP